MSALKAEHGSSADTEALSLSPAFGTPLAASLGENDAISMHC